MSSQGNNLFADSLGSVTILTDEKIVYQGQIHKHRGDSRKSGTNVVVEGTEFILLELRCEPAIIDDGQLQVIDPPLYSEDDVVRINVAKIISVGPSNGCLGTDTGTGTNTKNTKNSKNSKNSNSNSNSNSKGN